MWLLIVSFVFLTAEFVSAEAKEKHWATHVDIFINQILLFRFSFFCLQMDTLPGLVIKIKICQRM